MTNLIEAFSQLGFSQYEGKAYSSLVGRGPLNGHEVAKASGIPPAKIYETLGRLAEKGAVLIQHGDPRTYVANPYEDVLATVRSRLDRAIQIVEDNLRQAPDRWDAGEIWSLKDYESVITALRRRIDEARSFIFAAFWDAELKFLGPALEAASHRGVTVHIAVYGHAHLEGPDCYDLRLCGESAAKRLGGRHLSAVACDDGETMVAVFHNDREVDAIATTNQVINLLAVEYIKADVLGRILINELGNERFAEMRTDSQMIDRILTPT